MRGRALGGFVNIELVESNLPERLVPTDKSSGQPISYFPAKLSIAQKYSCRSRPVTSVKVLLKV